MSTPSIASPIFIVGPGRSGTTLLRSVLSAHSRMVVTPETHFMKRVAKAGGLVHAAPADFDAFWNDYTQSTRFSDLGVDPGRCLKIVAEQGERTFRAAFYALLAAYGEREGTSRVGEKTPGHVRFLPLLLAWFPAARVVVVQRDPRAVVASQLRSPWVRNQLAARSLRQGWTAGTRLYQAAWYAADWVEIFERIVPAWEGDARMRTVAYEALVEDTEGEVRRLCEFLGEPFEPAMLSDRTSDTVPRPAGTEAIRDERWRRWRQEHHAQTLRPVSTDSLAKWKEGLTPLEIAVVEGRCERGMRAAGYAPSVAPYRRAMGRAVSAAVLGASSAEAVARSAVRKALRLTRRLRT